MKAEYIAHFGDDLTVVNAARVSFAKAKTELDERDTGLIQYLARHGHTSPFFHPQVQLRITAPIFIARQWYRSNVGVARNEVSRRYVDDGLDFFRPDEWRRRPDGTIKQGSGESVGPEVNEKFRAIQEELEDTAQYAYTVAIATGIAPEQARMLLPQSMETQWIETGSLAYFSRVCKQRLDPHAQKEIQTLAQQVGAIIQPLFPVSWLALWNA